MSVTPAFLRGMTGLSARHPSLPLLASDLTHWLLPGLIWCGIQGELLAVPDLAAEGLLLLRQQLRRSQQALLFAFSASIDPAARPDAETASPMAVWTPDPMVTRQGIVTAVKSSHLMVSVADGTAQSLSYEELKTHFSHLLLMRKSTQRGFKAAHREAALRTWALFARAYPTRFLHTDKSAYRRPAEQREKIEKEEDANIREQEAALRTLGGAFWRELAGSDRSAAATSLRRLAVGLETARTPLAIQIIADTLAERTCRQFQLPPFVEKALTAPASSVLTDVERRELIYLARSGTRDIKVFAAYRLRFERECADARSTLQQLRFDPDAWVRAAARL